MTYFAPLDDMVFALLQAAGDGAFEEGGLYGDLGDGVAESTLAEAAKFAEQALHPLDRVGDRIGARFSEGAVICPPGWREAYSRWRDGGWNALAASPEFGGLGLPALLNAACTEIWNGANMAFALCPLLGQGAIEALEAHASEELKRVYLARVVSGEWTATMNLTEPQAGSDLSLVRTRAERSPDGAYRLKGQKIFITYGEHDLAGNIVHLVLARLPDAPEGTRGLSLFLAPKFLPGGDGRFTLRNDLRCAGLEHKLGIHGSPTCTMIYGDSGGATAWLVGEENKGLACMFTMMNSARLAVGLQGVGLAERATQTALAYARERRQGRSGADQGRSAERIVEHPDVMRMALTMQVLTQAARAICYETAASIDRARRERDPVRAGEADERAALLTPVAKGFSTDIANETASLGVQIFGGMGFIEETGAAQLMRDARILPIYEGTNGIQAIDLVGRKLRLGGGGALRREIADMYSVVEAAGGFAASGVVREAVAALEAASRSLLEADTSKALAGATPYLRLFALARGATLLMKGALSGDPRRVALARFFADNVAVAAPSLARVVVDGAPSLLEAGGTLL
ncbi:acyl-CoA dehydrogenase [Methylocystis heyeri]|uniref:3-methylmercaptopropionyl-CoA dehydrogenase n=1 Tax=Methylocystis heyeri TaxID=391905 RepID=A0A6B8KKS6_9HYPH|nr:acyl-CoA dehydrogenase [Methylocystis heyeri]QGM47515.1 acyl-CoA dehydrogenase [Methylocystis heyeri]